MRLFLLPISTRRTLIYCEPVSSSIPAAEQSYFDKGVAKATTTWAAWEKSDSTWKLKLTEYGNKALRRIPFEEWGLKSIPQLKKKQRQALLNLLEDRNAPGTKKEIEAKTVEVRYPRAYQALGKETVAQVLQRFGSERQGLHQRRLIWSVIAMPFTAPFALIPILPNIPFLYLVFRAYSHWTALNGAKHLEFLVQNSLLSSSPSSTLDNLYTAGLLHSTRDDSRKAAEPTVKQTKQVIEIIQKQLDGTGSGGDINPPFLEKAPPKTDMNGKKQSGSEGVHESQEEEILLLSGWNGKLLAEKLELPDLELEIERAVEQVERDMQKGKELGEEKESLDKATAKSQPKADPTNPKR